MEKILGLMTNKWTHNDALTRVSVAFFALGLIVVSWWWALSVQSNTVIEIGPAESQLSIDEL